VSQRGSRRRILVIATREDLTMLQDVIQVLDAIRNPMNP
jgi:hypothetical protein